MSDPELARFRAGFSRFLRPGRILLTGHSHQAWPDRVRDAMVQYFDDSATYVDDKWEQVVFPKVQRVGRAILSRMGFAADDAISFGRSSHELVFRLLSAIPAFSRKSNRARLITTTGEFHSLRRQFARMEEDGIEICWVERNPAEDLCDRLRAELVKGADVLALSAVFFEDATILQGWGELAAEAISRGTLVIVDAYHAFNVVPLDMGPRAQDLFVVAGGYKYAEFGEGLCFLRSPPGCQLRPIYTGWFSDFGSLEQGSPQPVRYGEKGDRFAGATFDPTSFYRAEAALAHFDAFQLDVARLRRISIAQTGLVVEALAEANLPIASPREARARGGFVAVEVQRASAAQELLRREGIFVDTRGTLLRMGPAPYLLDEELRQGVDAVVRVLKQPL